MLIGATLCLLATAALGQSNKVVRLGDVRSVYVNEFGQTEQAKAVRQEIIRQLRASGRITVAAAPDAAEALLRLSVKQSAKNIDWSLQAFNDPALKTGSRVVPVKELVFRLSTQQSQTLWVSKFDEQSIHAQDERQAGRVLANKLGQGLLKAVEKDSKRRPSR